MRELMIATVLALTATASAEQCGTVDAPWQGSLPKGNYDVTPKRP